MSSLLPWTSPQDQEKKREAVLEWAKKRREEREQAEKEMEEGVDIENDQGGSIFSFFGKESTRDKIKKKRKSRQIKQETGGLLSMLPFTKKEEEEEEEDESFMYEPSVWDKARWKLVDWRRQSTPSRGRICCCCSGFCCILTIVLIVLILLASAAITFAMNNKWIFAL